MTMTLEEAVALWPDEKIAEICNATFDKLRNILGINFIYISTTGWKAEDEELDGEPYIGIKVECPNKPDRSKTYFFVARLFTIKHMPRFDEENGANKMASLRDKVILRLARNFKEYWGWEN